MPRECQGPAGEAIPPAWERGGEPEPCIQGAGSGVEETVRSPASTNYASEGCQVGRTEHDEAPPAGPSDDVLLRTLGTDRAALGPLYDRHGGLVFGLARAILQSQEEAEDLTQEIFVMLCQGTTFDPRRGSLGAFLTTLTRSRAIDRLRRRGRRLRLLRASWQDAPPPDRPGGPAERIATRESSLRVRSAMAELPANERQALEMVYYQGLTQAEIAATLNAPLGTVKSWCRRGLLGLREALADLVE